jgi:micrococcal nuclease
MPIRTNVQQGAVWCFPVLSWRVYDGDTVMDMRVDLGFGVSITIDGRLVGIDTPELRGVSREHGLMARDYLRSKMDAANTVEVVSTSFEVRQGKYGRWLVEIYADGVNLNRDLVEQGLAEYRSY